MSIDSYRQTQTQTISAALAEAAGVGGLAPSIHNTQPWQWRVDGDTLELYAEPPRQLPASDPCGRTIVLSCGAALHHARAALAALGWRVEVDRIPDPGRPRLLARLRLSGRLAVTREAMRSLHTIRFRHTDWRPVAAAPIASGAIDAIRVAVEVEHAWLHTLRPSDVLDLATAVDRAQTLEEFDPLRTGHDDATVYAILFGTEDTPSAWLHAGEALSAAWLTAIEHGLSVLPLSAVAEVETTRVILRRLLAQLGDPFLVLAFGHSDPQVGRPPTARLRSAKVVEVVGETGSTQR
jgi:nitroreductase